MIVQLFHKDVKTIRVGVQRKEYFYENFYNSSEIFKQVRLRHFLYYPTNILS